MFGDRLQLEVLYSPQLGLGPLTKLLEVSFLFLGW